MKKIVNFLSKVTKNGFYIILFLCLCAIGVSGYVMFQTPEEYETLSDFEAAEEVLFPEESQFDFKIEEALAPDTVVVEDIPAVKEEPVPQKKEEPPKKKEVQKEPEKLTFSMPLEGEISLPFSGEELVKSKTMGDWRVHTGVDLKAEEGTKVCAVARGTVKDVFEDEMMGHTVVIEHEKGCESTYSNLMKGITVKKGQKVDAGQVIGGVGDSAVSECLEPPHLHLELTKDNKKIDPMSMIK